MMSAATVFGHLPLVFVSGLGAEARNSTGVVVGALFTLIVVPGFYSLLASKHRHAENTEEDSRTSALPSPQPTAA